MVQEFDKSLTDYKNYRVISLENNIKVVLISDIKPDSICNTNDSDCDSDDDNSEREIQKSAAALCVNVGNFNDPMECQGLAHFLEHMVFMGSAKYPTENDFDSYVTQHGGSSNAFTDVEHTVFYFDSHFEHFESILDKFANFFICPLFLKDSVDREIDAIHSEFEMMYSNDLERIDSLLRSLSKQESPYQKFHCGNRKSLKTDPEEKNIDIYKYLKEFWKNMYLSQFMTLAVQSRDTLDNLEIMVRSIFSNIPGNEILKPNTSCFSKPFQTEAFSKFYYVVPIKDIKALKLTWSLPCVRHYYKSKPLNIIGHFLGHEGHGSLTAYFRKKNYVVEFQAGHDVTGLDNTSFNSLFTIFIRLTEQGFENVTEIIRIIFSYIDLLITGGIPKHLFEEYKQISYNYFLFKEMEDPRKVVENLALNLQIYEPQHVISGSEIVYEYQPELYSEMLSYLSVDNLNVMLLSRSNESKTNMIQEWFDVKFTMRDFTEQERKRWSVPGSVPELHLPKENPFLATKFDLVELESDSNEVPVDLTSEFPELGKHGELWYQLDRKFRIPKEIINFYMWSPKISENAANACLTDLILYAVNQELSTVAYDASIAGLDYKVASLSSGIVISINGFSDKISLLFQTVIDFLRDFTICEEKFLVYVESVRQSYRNLLIKPNKLQTSIQKKILYPEEWMVAERLKALKDLNVQDAINFHKNHLFSFMRIRSYFHGNLSKEEAKSCFVYCATSLKLPVTESIPNRSVRQICSKESIIRVMNLNPHDTNTVINISFHIGPGTIELEAINELLIHILSEPSFNFLRTKETLGYYVGVTETNNRGILGMSLFVHSQANKFSVDYCLEKMNVFFEIVALDIIENLSDEDFNIFKASFIANKLEEDVQMSVAETRNWGEICAREFVFDRHVKHASFVENLTNSDLLKFFVDRYLNKSEQRKLIIQVDAKEKPEIVNYERKDKCGNQFDVDLVFVSVEADKKPVEICDIVSDMSVIPSHQISQ